jgi:hypothetical protein
MMDSEERIAELEKQLEEALKPRLPSPSQWYTGFDYLDYMPSEIINDGKHPDIKEYERMMRVADNLNDKLSKSRNNFNGAADLLDKAILALVRNGEEEDIIDEYREFMGKIKNTISSEIVSLT